MNSADALPGGAADRLRTLILFSGLKEETVAAARALGPAQAGMVVADVIDAELSSPRMERTALRAAHLARELGLMQAVPSLVGGSLSRDRQAKSTRSPSGPRRPGFRPAGSTSAVAPTRTCAATATEARMARGIDEKTALVHAGLEALIARESARRLAALVGSSPKLEAPRRRRSEESQ